MDSIVREKISISWARCHRMKVDKTINKLNERINKNKLEEIKKKNKNLIKIFNYSLDKLLERYSAKNTFFLLTDKNMVIISKKSNLKKDHSIKVREGDCFSENSCGTNAISISKEVGDKVYLKGDDHYCYLFKDWQCIAAPIIVNKKIIAFLDVSILNREIKEKDKMLFDLLYQSIKSEIIKLSVGFKRIFLNEKEKDILKLAAKGYSIKEIAKKMNLSSSAIKYHRKNICDKLGAENITHAVAKALKNNI